MFSTIEWNMKYITSIILALWLMLPTSARHFTLEGQCHTKATMAYLKGTSPHASDSAKVVNGKFRFKELLIACWSVPSIQILRSLMNWSFWQMERESMLIFSNGPYQVPPKMILSICIWTCCAHSEAISIVVSSPPVVSE